MDLHAPRVSAWATGFLVKGGHIDYTERIAVPSTQKVARMYPDDKPLHKGEADGKLNLMPNPTKNYVVIEYDLLIEGEQGIIIIRDAKGVAVKNLGLHKTFGQITVGIEDIPSGIYIVSLYAGNKHIVSKQLSISH